MYFNVSADRVVSCDLKEPIREDLMRGLLVLVLICVCSVAEARPRRVYNSGSTSAGQSANNFTYTSNTTSSANIGSSDQERCQAEANYMAANNITGHVWGCIGSFEGVGYGSSPNCNTCTPSSRMNNTGDASAQGRNGMWYRVRSWR